MKSFDLLGHAAFVDVGERWLNDRGNDECHTSDIRYQPVHIPSPLALSVAIRRLERQRAALPLYRRADLATEKN